MSSEGRVARAGMRPKASKWFIFRVRLRQDALAAGKFHKPARSLYFRVFSYLEYLAERQCVGTDEGFLSS